MDYCIKTDSLAHVGKPLYFLSFQTENNLKLLEGEGKGEGGEEGVGGAGGRVDLTCNMEELQDLVSKLKDATRQMERIQGELTPSK